MRRTCCKCLVGFSRPARPSLVPFVPSIYPPVDQFLLPPPLCLSLFFLFCCLLFATTSLGLGIISTYQSYQTYVPCRDTALSTVFNHVAQTFRYLHQQFLVILRRQEEWIAHHRSLSATSIAARRCTIEIALQIVEAGALIQPGSKTLCTSSPPKCRRANIAQSTEPTR